MSDLVLLSSLWLIPLIGMLIVLAIPKGNESAIRWTALAATIVTFAVSLVALGNYVNDPDSRKPLEERAASNALSVQASTEAAANEAEVCPVRPGGPPALDPLVQHRVLPGARRDQPEPGRAHRADRRAGVPGLVEHRQADQGLFRALPAAERQHDGGVPGARPVPVLRLLRGDAAADVLPHRHLGGPEARVRGDQVPAVHPVRLGVHPGGGPDPLLLAGRRDGAGLLGALVRHRPPHDDRQHDRLLRPRHPVLDLPAVLHRLHRQAAVVPVPHLAPRRARRGADADQHDPGGRPAEDRRLRPDPAGLAAGAGRRVCLRLRRGRAGDRQHPLRRPGGDGPDRLQEAGRLQLGQPHGLRDAGHGRDEPDVRRPRRTGGTTPTASTARCS